jgi:hypothetical protein
MIGLRIFTGLIPTAKKELQRDNQRSTRSRLIVRDSTSGGSFGQMRPRRRPVSERSAGRPTRGIPKLADRPAYGVQANFRIRGGLLAEAEAEPRTTSRDASSESGQDAHGSAARPRVARGMPGRAASLEGRVQRAGRRGQRRIAWFRCIDTFPGKQNPGPVAMQRNARLSDAAHPGHPITLSQPCGYVGGAGWEAVACACGSCLDQGAGRKPNTLRHAAEVRTGSGRPSRAQRSAAQPHGA